jgi:thioredoxin-like negative regulator of GroEL
MRFLIILAATLPGFAYAAGGDSFSPPKGSKTSKVCKGVKVWDTKKKRCVNPKQSELGTDTLYEAVRELAYAGRYDDAQGVLAAMPDQKDDRVLTYWGFTHRKKGDTDLGNQFYRAALVQNPDNILARSYMGQGMVEAGDVYGAKQQLAEIRARGGVGTWPELALAKAINTGDVSDY